MQAEIEWRGNKMEQHPFFAWSALLPQRINTNCSGLLTLTSLGQPSSLTRLHNPGIRHVVQNPFLIIMEPGIVWVPV